MNLILKTRGKRSENTSSRVLEYLLNEYDSCLAGFMSLFNIETNFDGCSIKPQYRINNGIPDLVIHDNKEQWIVVIENKPWDDSQCTSINEEGDQLKRYANHLKDCNFQRKTLCLLATEGNKDELVQAANVGDNEGVEFIVVTWEQLLNQFESIHSADTIPGFLIRELREYVLPPSVTISPDILQDEVRIRENWQDVKILVKRVKDIVKNYSSLSNNYSFANSPGIKRNPNAESMNFCGYYITDKNSNLTYFFSADMSIRRFLGTKEKQSLFALQTRFKEYQNGFHNNRDGRPIIDPEILTKCGFEYEQPRAKGTWQSEYVFPLTDPSEEHDTSPEKLAEALSTILMKTSEMINAKKNKSDS